MSISAHHSISEIVEQESIVIDTVDHVDYIKCLALAGNHLYSVDNSGYLGVWAKDTLEHVQTVEHSEMQFHSIAIHKKCIYLGCGYMNTPILVWDLPSLEPIAVMSGHTATVLRLLAYDDILLSGSADGTIRTWSTDRYTLISNIDANQHIVLSIAIDDEYIYAGGIANQINVYDRTDNSLVAELIGHDANVFSLAVDTKYVYSGSGEIWWGGPGSPRPPSFESAVRVWDKKTWGCIDILDGHKDNINDIALNDSMYYSISDDGTLRVYHGPTNSERAAIELTDRHLVCMTHDEDNLYIVGQDRTIRLIPKRIFIENLL